MSGEVPGGAPGSKPVVVTRAESAEGPLSSQLRSLGLGVLLWPAVSTRPADGGQLEAALRRIGEFDWIVFASRRAVAAVLQTMALPPVGLQVAAVGQATAQVLTQRGWKVDLLPEESNAAALVAAFESRLVAKGLHPGSASAASGDSEASARARAADILDSITRAPRVLFPASSRSLPTIAAGLRQLGAHVVQVEAYRTEPAALDVEECRTWIERDGVGAVTFASPSAVIELERSLGREDFGRLLAGAPAVAIGPTTARELTDRGRSPVLAESATLQGLARTTHRLLQVRH